MTPTQGEHAQTEAMYAAAMEFAAEKASISYVQRKCRCSYNDAERMLERMVSEGIIETYSGRKAGAQVAALTATPAQPAAPQGVAYAELSSSVGDYKYGGGLYTDAQMRDFADRTHALRAARGQEPASRITVKQVEDLIGLQSTAWDTIGAEKIVEAVLRLANAKAPAAGAVAGPSDEEILNRTGSPYAPGTREYDLDLIRWYRERIAAAPTPAAQADSALEDAARWNEVLNHVGADNLLGGAQYVLRGIQAPMNVMQGSVAQHFTKSIDAARKQGGTHDNH